MMRSYCNIGEDVFLQNVQIKVQYEQRGSFGLKDMFKNMQGEIAPYATGTQYSKVVKAMFKMYTQRLHLMRGLLQLAQTRLDVR